MRALRCRNHYAQAPRYLLLTPVLHAGNVDKAPGQGLIKVRAPPACHCTSASRRVELELSALLWMVGILRAIQEKIS